ncbi:MAG: hypothetical protein OEZ06_12275 [Myxococcales bacterium]|nr:hypothetical protein [Myxococcales bacterium]
MLATGGGCSAVPESVELQTVFVDAGRLRPNLTDASSDSATEGPDAAAPLAGNARDGGLPDAAGAVDASGDLENEDEDGGQATGRLDDCLEVSEGQRVVTGQLTQASPRWLPIQVPAACPATAVLDVEVAYRGYRLCAAPRERRLELILRGADMLEPSSDALADPLLVVYPAGHEHQRLPFGCLAASDDGDFDGRKSDSARIAEIAVAAGEALSIVASSAQPPAQRGVGRFELQVELSQ